jgi:hypothetical protein
MYGSRGCTARVALERYVSTAVFWQIDQQSENLMMVLFCLARPIEITVPQSGYELIL